MCWRKKKKKKENRAQAWNPRGLQSVDWLLLTYLISLCPLCSVGESQGLSTCPVDINGLYSSKNLQAEFLISDVLHFHFYQMYEAVLFWRQAALENEVANHSFAALQLSQFQLNKEGYLFMFPASFFFIYWSFIYSIQMWRFQQKNISAVVSSSLSTSLKMVKCWVLMNAKWL